MTADLSRPLADCPVGSHVVHDGKVRRVCRHWGFLCLAGLGQDEHDGHRPDDRVLLLEGHQPRSLAECEDRHVWLHDPRGGFAMEWDGDQECWWDDTGGQWRADRGDGAKALVYPIVAPDPAPAEPARWISTWGASEGEWMVLRGDPEEEAIDPMFTTEDRTTADALADHLNRTGWEPPAPEPERPTAAQVLDATFRPMVIAGWPEMGEHAVEQLAQHGYEIRDAWEDRDA